MADDENGAHWDMQSRQDNAEHCSLGECTTCRLEVIIARSTTIAIHCVKCDQPVHLTPSEGARYRCGFWLNPQVADNVEQIQQICERAVTRLLQVPYADAVRATEEQEEPKLDGLEWACVACARQLRDDPRCAHHPMMSR